MEKVEFQNFTVQVQGNIEDLAMQVLEEAAGELESQVKRNTKVDTGKTKNSWKHHVTNSGVEFKAVVGSDYMNSIWEEFGTGEYALEGKGRKGGWFYVDEKGKGHFTHGKKPRRPFWNAYTTLKSRLIKHIQDRFKGGMS